MSEDDSLTEAHWLSEQRSLVIEYLANEGITQPDVPPEPSWLEYPFVAIWPIGSRVRDDAIGWWAISGDVPTDYVSSSEIRTPRAALQAFGNRWTRASKRMARGEEPDEFRIGSPDEWKALAPLLASRAQLLTEWASDDDLWS